METIEELVAQHKAAVERWDAFEWPRPKVCVVSGSGLAVDLGERAHGPIPLEALLPFEVHPVDGHPHSVEVIYPLPERPVLYYRGRLHSYQGYSGHETVFPIRLAALLGCEVLVMTNSSGGLKPGHKGGDLVLITDHLNLSGMNPLRGSIPSDWGPRFPDMTHAYDPRLLDLAREAARAEGVPLDEGVYAGLAGPSYETPAEVRMLQQMGGHLAGMSTVLEVIAANHMGVKSLGISMVANPGAGLTGEAIAHEDVLAAGRLGAAKLENLLRAILRHPGLV